ncbi:Uncharacterised protein [uncultured archaeon]|nr:Uncharacterised protein [uncultured archaeon]
MDKPRDRINDLELILGKVENLIRPIIYNTFQLQTAPIGSNILYSDCSCNADRPGCNSECYCDSNESFCFFVCNTHQINCCQSECNCDMNF